MASGYSSLHPQQKAVCKEIGILNGQVTQGYGHATASAGYHSPESTYDGRPFSSCFDLSMQVAASKQPFHRLIQAGVCPFLRTVALLGWPEGVGLGVVGGRFLPPTMLAGAAGLAIHAAPVSAQTATIRPNRAPAATDPV